MPKSATEAPGAVGTKIRSTLLDNLKFEVKWKNEKKWSKL
jgi:hypothetical protein